MHPGVLTEKSYLFAVRIVKLCNLLKEEHKEFVMTKQLLKAGTSVGAQVSEAVYAESKADFIHKLSIAQKEIAETIYWLKLLNQTDYLSEAYYISINNDATEIIKLLTSILKKLKSPSPNN